MSERKPIPATARLAVRRLRRGGAALAAGCALAAAIPLGGCVDVLAPRAPAPEAAATALFVRRPGVSLAGASVAFVSVEGPPAAVSAEFLQSLARAAAAQDIVVVEPRNARYLVRGYLSAYATEDGAAVEFVWDVFNKDRQRAQRVSDILDVRGAGGDPWRIAGETGLGSVAAKSADDLAAFLSNTPEAVEAPAALAAEGKPLSFAPVD